MIKIETFKDFIKDMLAYDPALIIHCLGVSNIAWQLAIHLKMESQLNYLAYGGLLHDIGKVKIPKSILHKQGPLTDAEKIVIQRHPIEGVHALALQNIKEEFQEIVLYHHERWDGAGYLGIRGDNIPLNSQIISLADAIDAMLSNRPYRAARSPLEVYADILRCSGSQFSPNLVKELQQSRFWPKGESPLELVNSLLEYERWWLNYLEEVFKGLRHPLILIQSKKIDRLLISHYKHNNKIKQDFKKRFVGEGVRLHGV
ncbi:MAG: HD domain-containing protein [Bacillota bacterium]|nr:HD domain-containing protein [Bacillota bacterium]